LGGIQAVTGGDAPKPCRTLKTWKKMPGSVHRAGRICAPAVSISRRKARTEGNLTPKIGPDFVNSV
jgi:hypothetical protein